MLVLDHYNHAYTLHQYSIKIIMPHLSVENPSHFWRRTYSIWRVIQLLRFGRGPVKLLWERSKIAKLLYVSLLRPVMNMSMFPPTSLWLKFLSNWGIRKWWNKLILPQYYSPSLHLIIYACQICKIEKAKKCGKTQNFLKVCTRSGLTVYEEILRRWNWVHRPRWTYYLRNPWHKPQSPSIIHVHILESGCKHQTPWTLDQKLRHDL